ncbi:MbtH family protein [Streptomyces iranensis]|uniref:MbtH family protein n=1 Tax=Streptomyces iranensis TaxID=576784 RepID=UPI0039B72384
MTNPFDEEAADFCVLVNDEDQYSLWPATVDVPAGWRIALEKSPRKNCLEYIEAHWVDMRPRSLRDSMAESSGR